MATEDFRVVNTRLDQERSLEINSDGNIVSSKAVVFRGTQALFRVDVINEDETSFSMPSDAAFLFGIDDASDDGTDLVVSDNSQFNITDDDTGETTADPTAGRLTWRADLTTQNLADALGTTAGKDMTAEVWMTPSGGQATLIAQWPIRVNNIFVDVGITQGPSPGAIVTTAVIEQFEEDGIQKVRIKNADGVTVQTFTPPGF